MKKIATLCVAVIFFLGCNNNHPSNIPLSITITTKPEQKIYLFGFQQPDSSYVYINKSKLGKRFYFHYNQKKIVKITTRPIKSQVQYHYSSIGHLMRIETSGNEKREFRYNWFGMVSRERVYFNKTLFQTYEISYNLWFEPYKLIVKDALGKTEQTCFFTFDNTPNIFRNLGADINPREVLFGHTVANYKKMISRVITYSHYQSDTVDYPMYFDGKNRLRWIFPDISFDY